MSKINVTSKNQSGGITASDVSFSDFNSPKHKRKSTWKTIIIIIGLIASVVTILAYFNIFPFHKTINPAQQTNGIKSNINSPISSNIENQTINYFQSDTSQLRSAKPKIKPSKMKKEKEKEINVTSYNQSGGITANQVNIGTTPRGITPESEEVFLNEIKNYPARKILIKALFSDAESQHLSMLINNTFKKAGWTIEGPIYEIPNQPMNNIIMGVPDAEKQSKITSIIYMWLTKNNLKVLGEIVPEETGFVIYVGLNK
jgi:hypothetical protein